MDYYSIPRRVLMFQINIPPSKVYSSPACIYRGPDRVYTIQCVYSVIGETKLFPQRPLPTGAGVAGLGGARSEGHTAVLQCCRLQTDALQIPFLLQPPARCSAACGALFL